MGGRVVQWQGALHRHIEQAAQHGLGIGHGGRVWGNRNRLKG
jgi:hypothetical protein